MEFLRDYKRLQAENAELRKVAKMMLLTLKSKGIAGGIFTYQDRNSNAEEWVTFESYLRKFGIEA